jgi:hypothetical protein
MTETPTTSVAPTPKESSPLAGSIRADRDAERAVQAGIIARLRARDEANTAANHLTAEAIQNV